jgi:hypothetical protein
MERKGGEYVKTTEDNIRSEEEYIWFIFPANCSIAKEWPESS